jgi:DNA-directed RNA polymerase specialized sigma24 family protein
VQDGAPGRSGAIRSADADDARQELVVHSWAKGSLFASSRSRNTFLDRITSAKAIDLVRRARAQKRQGECIWSDLEPGAVESSTPTQPAAPREADLRLDVRDAIVRLPVEWADKVRPS